MFTTPTKSARLRSNDLASCDRQISLMAAFSRVFTLVVDGRPILAFEAGGTREAHGICKEMWLRDDLTVLRSGGVPLYTTQSKLSVRLATAEEETIFFDQTANLAKPSDEMFLGYLIQLDA